MSYMTLALFWVFILGTVLIHIDHGAWFSAVIAASFGVAFTLWMDEE